MRAVYHALGRTALGLGCAASLVLSAASASAVTLFSEDFDGYTSFPDEHPANDFTNAGLPMISEGADEKWYGIRFQTPDGGTINQDLAVQQFGGGSNSTPVGRMEDEAGLVFEISTLGMVSTSLSFDWRTFSASGADRLRAGYYVGDIPAFNSGDFLVATSGTYAWSNWIEFTLDPASGQTTTWQFEGFALPSGVANVHVAFWLDNGEGDFGKIDNIAVNATVIPEPSTAALFGLGFAALVAARHRASR